jgi:hypothetical protein
MRKITILFCLILAPAWAGEVTQGDAILSDYHALLDRAENGGAQEKIALFLHTEKHSDQLAEHAATVLELLAEASNQGSGQASFYLAQMSENGVWIEKDQTGAEIYYVLAAQQGYAKAMVWCISHFARVSIESSAEGAEAKALGAADRWYKELSASEVVPDQDLRRAIYTYGLARLQRSLLDERGWEVMNEAAVDGNPKAVSFVRNLHSIALSGLENGDADASKLVSFTQPTIDVIGASD